MSHIHKAQRLSPAAFDALIALAAGLGGLALYIATLLPGIGSGDTAEFQRVVPTLGVAHPTGYPLYTILGWLWSQLPLGATPAWRMNLFSAGAAALAVGTLFLAARALAQARAVAAAAALTLATSLTFWSQATIAEVYALAALLQALLILALLRWHQGVWPLWVAGLALGLGLAHHRTIILMIPGALVFWVLEARRWSLAAAQRPQASSLKSQAFWAVFAMLAGCLLYMYLPLHAPQWIESPRAFAQYVAGSSALSVWLATDAPWRVAWEHLSELAQRLIWPQFFPIGAMLAVLGLVRIWRRDRAAAALLTISYVLVLLFCTLFFVQDVEVFLISAHIIAALLLGEGAMLLVDIATDHRRTTDATRPWSFVLRASPFVGLAVLLLPALLAARNLGPIRAANTGASEAIARATLAQPLPDRALLIVDWEAVEGLRYLQAIEGLRPDVEVRPLNADVASQDAAAALAAGRALYLLRPRPELGLAQSPEGRLWRVSTAPLALRADTPADQRWQDGITLRGFSLPRGPYQPGDSVPVTLEWQTQGAAPRQRYTLFVHIVGDDGVVRGQQDREPTRAPTDKWQPNQRLIDVYGPALSLATPPGRYKVVIGWYSYPSLSRLPRAGAPGDTSTLGEIEVLAR
ncbi:MAG TPA: DUF2723 domain-containing protein [Roseiflexaceae bacterium]|nr:DUF2723 domain-containing protein [Roseiflexaceae bacterium]